MALSKRQREGWLLIDNRLAPPEEGVPRFMEAATSTCSHCQQQVVRNPVRMRERAYCPSCDAYICDRCEGIRAVNGCRPFEAVIVELSRNLNTLRIF